MLFEDEPLSNLLLSTFIARREALQQVAGVGVEIIGPHSSAATMWLLEFARSNRLPLVWRNPERGDDPEAAALVAGLDPSSLPRGDAGPPRHTHGLAAQLRSFRIAMQVRAGLADDAARALPAESEPLGESLTAVAAVRLAKDRPADALAALEPLFDGSAPVIHEFTTAQAEMLAAQAAEALGDRPASEAAVEPALAHAERERLVLPFAMAGGLELLRRHPRHSTADANLLTEIVDILDGGGVPLTGPEAPGEELSAAELKILGYLPARGKARRLMGIPRRPTIVPPRIGRA